MKTSFEELKNHSFATDFLSTHLKKGTLVIFLGAGASSGFGLPNWLTLINNLRKEAGMDILSSTNTAEDLQLAADDILTKLGNQEKLISLIEKNLYDEINRMPSVNIFNNHLLVAISTLLMGSKRGHVSKVITLNYDSMLEWFLELFGFVVKTIHTLPELEGSEDVTIYHPHGYIPNPQFSNNKSNFIILGLQSANKRIGTPGDLWTEMIRHILDTSVSLFIGMSPNTVSDRALAGIFSTSGERHVNTRPLGIWIVSPSITPSQETQFKLSNIVPLEIPDVHDIPQFLLGISQKAIK